jgi:cytochrome d ubiquinol oxidase subunit I
MEDPALWHRLQFAFTITYHYLFPQLTMGLAWFLVYWKWRALRTGDERYAAASRFWAKIFGLNFAVGVVTGIPMEFQFGTNWANFSTHSGAVIGQTLAMEGMFAFLLESAFVGVLVWGERRLGPRTHFLAAVAVAVGSWLSAYFILGGRTPSCSIPSATSLPADGTLAIGDLSAYLLNPWALVLFAHNQAAALVTGTFAVTAVGALYALRASHRDQARLYLRHGTVAGLAAAVLVAFPTGDLQAKIVARYQEPALAAMEGRFETGPRAEITLIGQPNVKERRLDNPIKIPGMLSFLAYGTFHSEVRGLDAFPPENLASEHRAPVLRLSRDGRPGHDLHRSDGTGQPPTPPRTARDESALLWTLMLAFPFPFIANTAGWITTELGRQPMVDLRVVSHAGRLQRHRQLWRRAVHADRDGGTLLRPRSSVSVSRRSRDPARS